MLIKMKHDTCALSMPPWNTHVLVGYVQSCNDVNSPERPLSDRTSDSSKDDGPNDGWVHHERSDITAVDKHITRHLIA